MILNGNGDMQAALDEKNYKDRYKKLNNFVASLNDAEVGPILNALDENDVGHQFLRIHITARFRLHSEICKIIRGTDCFLIKKVLQFDFIFHGDSDFSTWQSFDAKILPVVSFTTRVKLLNNLRKYSEKPQQVEFFFIGMLEKYSLRQALIVLPACSREFIKSTIVAYKIRLSNSQLEKISRKHSDLPYWYLTQLITTEETDPEAYKKIISTYKSNLKLLIKHFGAVSFQEFFTMYAEYIDEVSLGLRASKNIIQNTRQIVLRHAKVCRKLFRKEMLQAILTRDDFKVFFRNTFPQNIGELSEDTACESLLQILSKIPYLEKKALFNSTFLQVYNYDLTSNEIIAKISDYIPKQLAGMLEESQRKLWVEFKLKDSPEEVELLAVLPVAESVPRIQQLLAHATDPQRRCSLVKHLIETCYVNMKLDELPRILTWLVDRYRNDDVKLLREIGVTIDAKLGDEKFTERHWEPILSLMRLLIRNHEFSLFAHGKILPYCIAFRLQNNLPIDEQLTWMTQLLSADYSFLFQSDYVTLKIEKTVLEKFARALVRSYPADAAFWINPPYGIQTVLHKILQHNRTYPKDVISLNELKPLLNGYKKLISKNLWFTYDAHLIYNIEGFNELFDDLRKHFLIHNDFNYRAIMYYKKIDQEIVVSNVHFIVDNYVNEQDRLVPNWRELRQLKTLSWYGFPELIIKKCNDIILGQDRNNHWVKAVRTICFFAGFNNLKSTMIPDFLARLQPVDIEDPNASEIGISLAASIHLINPLVPLETLTPLCQGDWLLKSINSLRTIFLRTPRLNSREFIEKSLQPVDSPLHKHIIRLICETESVQERCKVLETWKYNPNPIMKQVFCKIIFRVVTREPEQNTFPMLMECLETLTENDTSTWLVFTTEMGDVPDVNFAMYCIKLWQKMQTVNFTDPTMSAFLREKYLGNITKKNVKLLPKAFLAQMLDAVVFIPMNGKCSDGLKFASMCLLNSSDGYHQTNLVTSLYKKRIIDQVRGNEIEDITERRLRNMSSEFTRMIFEACTTTTDKPQEVVVVRNLVQQMVEALKSIDALEDVLYLELSLVVVTCSKNLDAITEKMAEISFRFEVECGLASVLMLFKEPTLQVLQTTGHNRDEAILKFATCLKTHESASCQIMLAQLLNEALNSSYRNYSSYKAIVQHLKKSRHQLVRVYVAKSISE